jgi:transcriptional regulator with XRE-family HTH domain
MVEVMRRVVPKAFPRNSHIESTEQLGQYFKAARTQAGLKLDDAALILGVSVQTLVDIEAGRPSVTLGKLMSVAHGLGVDLFALPRSRRELARSRFLRPAEALRAASGTHQ